MCKKIAKTREVYPYKLGDVTRSKNLLIADGESLSLGRGFIINLTARSAGDYVSCVLTGNCQVQQFLIEPAHGDLLILNHWCGFILQVRAVVVSAGIEKLLISIIPIDGPHGAGNLEDVVLVSAHSAALVGDANVIH